VIAQAGRSASEYLYIDPDPVDAGRGVIEEIIRPGRSGRLFLYVNDTINPLIVPYDLFYRNNAGRIEKAFVFSVSQKRDSAKVSP
jgi:hypothetical protein